MSAAGPAGAAWTALLPAGAVARSATAPWSLRSRPGNRVRAYVAVPSRQHPLIVASWDRAVLRYVAETLLSVPPGAGPLLSAAAAVGLRLFRYSWSWRLAISLRAVGAVLVGRAE